MAYTYPVKWISSTMRGAPVMAGTAGAVNAALRAFLITGWGAANALSISVSGGVGTANFAEGTFFEAHSVVTIANVTTPAALNGEARVLSRTNDSITFETDAPDGVATTGGTISVKYAPVGSWEEVLSAGNVSVFRSTDVTGSRMYYRIDDGNTVHARIVGYEAMTDVNTGTGPFPTAAMMSGGGYIHKSYSAGSTAIPYIFAADSRAVLYAISRGVSWDAAYIASSIRGFGDPLVMSPSGDPWAAFISGHGSDGSSYESYGALSGSSNNDSGSSGFVCSARGSAGLGGSVFARIKPQTGMAATISGADPFMGQGPSAIDGQVKMTRLMLADQVTGFLPRAFVPGVLYIPQTGVTAFFTRGSLTSISAGSLAGRKLIAVTLAGNSVSSTEGIAFIDVTGTWR